MASDQLVYVLLSVFVENIPDFYLAEKYFTQELTKIVHKPAKTKSI